MSTIDPSALDATGAPEPQSASRTLIRLAVIGALVSVALGTYGQVHTATGERIVTFGFADTITMKAWLATGAAALAVVQAVSAAWMFGRLPRVGPAPSAVAAAHRWSGTAAFVLTLPVAYHCLWSLGFRSATPRVLIHSVLGCLFYGAFVTKMLTLRSKDLPGWALPVVGGVLVALLAGLWTTSSLWFFTTFS